MGRTAERLLAVYRAGAEPAPKDVSIDDAERSPACRAAVIP